MRFCLREKDQYVRVMCSAVHCYVGNFTLGLYFNLPVHYYTDKHVSPGLVYVFQANAYPDMCGIHVDYVDQLVHIRVSCA